MPSEQQTSSAGIKWSEVKWYPKYVAALFFLGILPGLCFYLGMRYQASRDDMAAVSPVLKTIDEQQVSDSTYPPQDTGPKVAITDGKYIDTTNGFSFTMPTGWILSLQRAWDYRIVPGPSFSHDIQIGVDLGVVIENAQNQGAAAGFNDFDAEFAKPAQHFPTKQEFQQGGMSMISDRKLENLTVGGFPATEAISIGGSEAGPTVSLDVLIHKGNTNYHVEAGGFIGNFDASRKALESVLSTWEFSTSTGGA